MKIGIITGSPKPKNSASRRLAQYITNHLKDENEIYEYNIPRMQEIAKEELMPFTSCDALIFLFPVYVDAVPGHMLPFLELLECCMREHSNHTTMVYAFSVCGFPRGRCGKYCMDMLRIWSQKSGLIWGQGGGCGAGEAIANSHLVSIGRWPFQRCGRALDSIIYNLLAKKSETDIFVEPEFHYPFFNLCAYKLWFSKRKGNKLSTPKIFFQTSLKK